MPSATVDPDSYLKEKKIPDLFQSLTVALLYNKPQDHIDYLIKCLDDLKEQPKPQVAWDSFLPQDRNHTGTPAANVRGTLNPIVKQ